MPGREGDYGVGAEDAFIGYAVPPQIFRIAMDRYSDLALSS